MNSQSALRPTVITLLLAVCGTAWTGCESIRKRQITARTEPESSIQAVQAGYDTVGRRWEVGEAAPAAPAPAAPPVPVHKANDYVSFERHTGLLHLSKRAPAAVSLGQEYGYDLNVKAAEHAGEVIVTDTIPEGATYLRSEPTAVREGNRLTWRFPAMNKGDAKNIKVFLKADKEGELSSCSTVHAVPQNCLTTFVGKPVLEIVKTGPETAVLGTDVTYNLMVRNRGTAVARGVTVTDPVPDGMMHASGQKTLSFNAGDLAPNATRNFQVTLKTAKRGRICNGAEVLANNAPKATSEVCTTVVQPGLKIVKTGDKQMFLNLNADYQIVVSNTGDTIHTGVVVTDTAPPQTRLVSASGATISGNQAVWNIASMKPGEEKAFRVSLTSSTPGTHCNGVTVATAQNMSDSSQVCTVWRGLSALLLEKADSPDPIRVGGTTTYTVRVTNQGTAEEKNVAMMVEFEKELTPISAGAGRIEGQKVSFSAVPTLAPKQSFEYTIVARGIAAGDSRTKFILTAESLDSPVMAEESTRVY